MTSEGESMEPSSQESPLFGEKKSDESWKAKAQVEKEKLADALEAQEGVQYPPASFAGLLEEISFRAMMALGQLRNPASGEAVLDLDSAKYAIDLLGVLEQKTRGNLSQAEEVTLRDLLHNLRLAFVHLSRQAGAPAAPGAAGGGKGALAPGPGKGPGPEKPGPKIIL